MSLRQALFTILTNSALYNRPEGLSAGEIVAVPVKNRFGPVPPTRSAYSTTGTQRLCADSNFPHRFGLSMDRSADTWMESNESIDVATSLQHPPSW